MSASTAKQIPSTPRPAAGPRYSLEGSIFVALVAWFRARVKFALVVERPSR